MNHFKKYINNVQRQILFLTINFSIYSVEQVLYKSYVKILYHCVYIAMLNLLVSLSIVFKICAYGREKKKKLVNIDSIENIFNLRCVFLS